MLEPAGFGGTHLLIEGFFMRRFAHFAVLTALALAGCREKATFKPPPDGGASCGVNERVFNGECRFVCDRDGDCDVGQRCNLFTGQCEAAPPKPDSGAPAFPCTTGAIRCRADEKGVEKCGGDGVWTTTESCPPPTGFCQNEKCLLCKPGATSCDGVNNKVANLCKDDGSGFTQISCSGTGVCVQGECRECAPNTTRCSPDGKAVQICSRSADPTLVWKWVDSGDAFDGSCITKVCLASPAPAHCQPPACFPGTAQCKNTTTQQICGDTGAYTDTVCSAIPGFGSGATCQNGVCVDECADAVKAKSYFGCEYWAAVTDNSVDSLFKGKTASGQGTNDSDFAFVLTNRSVTQATVDIYRFYSGAITKVKTVTLQPSTDAATKGLAVVKVPWQSIGAANATIGIGATGQGRYGYRVVSNKPITVYQFNPLEATKAVAKSCTPDFFFGPYSSDCKDYGTYNASDPNSWGVCENNNTCRYNTYSNDASLVLPSHILGTSYVVLSQEHNSFAANASTAPVGDGNGQMTIVGTQDTTTVTIKSSAKTLAGGGVTAMQKGDVRTVTMNSYDVLQFGTDNLGANYIECGTNPFGSGKVCRVDNDLTGTVITSDKPVAVFGGAACTLKPYDRVACDHIEEQIFPFSTWGQNFVGIRSAPLRLKNNQASTNSPPDMWKVVASCPLSQCPNGTKITVTPPPLSADVLLPNRCLTGTIAGNNCYLAGGKYMEFKHTGNFVVSADYPIAVAQFFPGQGSTSGANPPIQGDPSLVFLPPIEQWRPNYTVLSAPLASSAGDQYMAIAIDDSKVQSVELDGTVLTFPGTTIPGSTFKVLTVGRCGSGSCNGTVLSNGTHTIKVNARTGQTTLPGAGVTIYGYDAFMSYGYTGGLDLGTIVTGINPGG
jgi:hypothetical protein